MRCLDLRSDERRALSFYLAMEEYAAQSLWQGEGLFFMWRVGPTVICGRNQDIPHEVDLDYCRERGVECSIRKALYRANGRAQAAGQTDGVLKLVCGADGAILGCHALGANASFLVQEVAALMNFGATVDRLADIVHIHPTLGEILLDAAMG